MRRRLVLALLLAAAVLVPAARADGPPAYAGQDGQGVVSPDGTRRYVAIGSTTDGNTVLAEVRTADGTLRRSASLAGAWGIPRVTPGTNGGLSADGRTLVLGQTTYSPSGSFLVFDTRTMQMRTAIVLKGNFGFDALSPDGSRLYLIQHMADANRYVVRAYDLVADRLLPGRIADRTQNGWVMQGSAVARAVGPGGRWVYTLYQNPGGYPFVHALDTVRGVAHCVGLPFTGDQGMLANVRLSLADGGRSLALAWPGGRRWLSMDTSTWRLTTPHAGGSSWWVWPAVAGAAVLALLAALVVLRRRAWTWRPGAPVEDSALRPVYGPAPGSRSEHDRSSRHAGGLRPRSLAPQRLLGAVGRSFPRRRLRGDRAGLAR